MSYYTTFTLEVMCGTITDDMMDSLKALELRWEYIRPEEACCCAKWYDFADDMRRISSDFPSAVFALYGVGEEHGDYWVAYYHDGKEQMCRAEIVYDSYDPTKLE